MSSGRKALTLVSPWPERCGWPATPSWQAQGSLAPGVILRQAQDERMPPLLQKLLLFDLAAEAQPEAEGFLQVLEGLRGLLVGDETTVDVLIDDEQAYLVQAAAGGHQLRYDVLADAVLG